MWNFQPSVNLVKGGAGYVGGPTMAVIADHCPNLQITVDDSNRDNIKKWNSPSIKNLPFFEAGLEEIILRVRNKNLYFSSNVNETIINSDMIFLCVNTSKKNKGFGVGQASDLKWVESCARQVSSYSKGHTFVIEKSTLPVRTAESIKTILNSSNLVEKNHKTFSVLSNPEFLSEGPAINDFNKPDRVLIGVEEKKPIEALENIILKWIPNQKIIKTNLWSIELSKLTANAFLAQRISSINSIAEFCKSTGGNMGEVVNAIGTDQRIGADFLSACLGFRGSCFKKDISNLVCLSIHFVLSEVAEYWNCVIKLNEWQKLRISKLIVHNLFGTLRGKSITILGFAFKANTNDTIQSAAIDISKNLLEEGANLIIHDPKVSEDQIFSELAIKLRKLKNIQDSNTYKGAGIKENNLNKSFVNVYEILILTEWGIYKKINWKTVEKIIRKRCWFFDIRSIVDLKEIKNTNLNFWKIGDGIIKS